MEEHKAPGNYVLIEVPLHPRAHPSDILAKLIVRWYGGDKYGSGVFPAGPRVVMVGRGGYDEHDPENLPDPKRRECEATLVAIDLGVRDLPELQLILNYIRGADLDGAGKGFLKFARAVELLYDVYPNEPWRVERFAEVLIEAAIEVGRASQQGEPPKSVPPEVVSYFIKKAYGKVEPEFRLAVRLRFENRIRGWFEPSRLDFKPFGLPHCIVLLWQKFRESPVGERSVVEWVADAFRAELVKQRNFLAARREIDKLEVEELGEVALNVRGKGVIAHSVYSDSRSAHSYLLSHDYGKTGEIAIAVVRRSSGNVQIFRRRHGALVNVKLTYVAALLRAREQEKRGYPISTWDELIAARGPRGAECWFYRAGPEWILNGALTVPDVEPTMLTDEEILDCIARGLDDDFAEFRQKFRCARFQAAQ